jgi:hypothetical protein
MLALLAAAIPLATVFAEEQAPEKNIESVEASNEAAASMEANNLVEEAMASDNTEL